MEITINNKKFIINDQTHFAIQMGKGKSAYKDRYVFVGVGELEKALFYYRCINIGYGYKKRLVIDKKVVSRAFSRYW
jgi:hypothetical protein